MREHEQVLKVAATFNYPTKNFSFRGRTNVLTGWPGSPASPFLPFLPRLPGGPGGPANKNNKATLRKQFIRNFYTYTRETNYTELRVSFFHSVLRLNVIYVNVSMLIPYLRHFPNIC